MSLLLIGSEGSMGKRYQAILNYLSEPFFRRDLHFSEIADQDIEKQVGGIIIATPTDTHVSLIESCARYRVPILCEKPITKDVKELGEINRILKFWDVPFKMMSQYSLLSDCRLGESFYDYFRHGSDGLIWDCFQVIALATGRVSLSEKSPIWRCRINGQNLNYSLMDEAYIRFVIGWFNEPRCDFSSLIESHYKVSEFKNDG